MPKTLNESWFLPTWLRGWEQFWFAPADPTLLGLIRLTCGCVTLYTVFVYSFNLQEFMGEHAVYDLKLRERILRDRPVLAQPLLGYESAPPRAARDAFENEYVRVYQQRFNDLPPAPFPEDEQQAEYTLGFREKYKFDLRQFGLRPPATRDEAEYLDRYVFMHKVPPPAYPRSKAEEEEIEEYLKQENVDPRRLYSRGTPIFSVWLHVTDPAAMQLVHAAIVLVTFLFTIGFATRLTSVLTWFGMLCYIHRNPGVLFGADTMINILLTYLMVGPSGAALSVDRWIARWWASARPDVLRRWYAWFGQSLPDGIAAVPAPDWPEPSVAANLAVRLIQIHLCIIYFIAGLAKLQGTAWWNGWAPWGTLANYEFAPMHLTAFTESLRWLANHPLYLQIVLTAGTYFTLAFEITYPFLIWRPATRRVQLTGALVLHGLIGLFMGLQTFALIMLVMNLAFVKPEEIRWVMNLLGFAPAAAPKGAASPRLKEAMASAPLAPAAAVAAPAASSPEAIQVLK